MHDGDNAGLLANQTAQKRRINDSGGIHRKKRDLETFKVLQVFGRMEDSVVLHSGNDDMFAAHGMGAGDTDQAQIARLGAAPRKNNLMRLRPKQSRHAVACIIHRRSRPTPRRVDGGRIPILSIEKR
jgi:hypothetical protein